MSKAIKFLESLGIRKSKMDAVRMVNDKDQHFRIDELLEMYDNDSRKIISYQMAIHQMYESMKRHNIRIPFEDSVKELINGEMDEMCVIVVNLESISVVAKHVGFLAHHSVNAKGEIIESNVTITRELSEDDPHLAKFFRAVQIADVDSILYLLGQ